MRDQRFDRSGMSVLAMVMVFALVLGITVFAYNSMWRGSSQTLFSVQERRELMNLARSSLAEAYFRLQADLDVSKQKWFDWCTLPGVQPEVFVPALTRQNAVSMSTNQSLLAYTTSDVTMQRVVGIARLDDGNALGIVDLRVTVNVKRTAPYHTASITMVERRNFWFADDHGPFGLGGRHVEVSPTPAMTMIEEK